MQVSETILAAMRLHQWSAAEIADAIGMTPSALSRALKRQEIPEQYADPFLAALGLRAIGEEIMLARGVLLRWQLSAHGRGRESPTVGDLALMLPLLPAPRSSLRLEVAFDASRDWQGALRSQIHRAKAEDALLVYVVRGDRVWRLLYVAYSMRPETEKLLGRAGEYSELTVHNVPGTDVWRRISNAATPADMELILSEVWPANPSITWEDVLQEAERAGLTPEEVLRLMRMHAIIPDQRK